MADSRTIKVTQVRKLKEGQGPRGPWTLYGVVDEQGLVYTTFDAVWQERVGQQVQIEFEVVQRDGFENYRLVSEKKRGPRNGAHIAALERKMDTVIADLRDLHGKVDVLLGTRG